MDETTALVIMFALTLAWLAYVVTISRRRGGGKEATPPAPGPRSQAEPPAPPTNGAR